MGLLITIVLGVIISFIIIGTAGLWFPLLIYAGWFAVRLAAAGFVAYFVAYGIYLAFDNYPTVSISISFFLLAGVYIAVFCNWWQKRKNKKGAR